MMRADLSVTTIDRSKWAPIEERRAQIERWKAEARQWRREQDRWADDGGGCHDARQWGVRHIADRAAEHLPIHPGERGRRDAAPVTAPIEGSPGWRSGIEESIRRVEAMARKPRDLWSPAYFAAVDEALVHLQAMLERGTERSTTEVAGARKEMP